MSWSKLISIIIASVFIQQTNGEIPPDLGCGIMRICLPEECPVGGCVGFRISWWNTEQEYIRFEIQVEHIAGDYYVALGFSKEKSMPDSDIVMCRPDVTAKIQLGTTQNRTYVSKQDMVGIRNNRFTVVGNISTCSFERIKENKLGVSLTDPYYLLWSWGKIPGGIPAYHGPQQRGVSKTAYRYPVVPIESSSQNFKPASVSLCVCLLGAWLFYMLQ